MTSDRQIIEVPPAHSSSRPLVEPRVSELDLEITDEELKKSSHARLVRRYQTETGFAKRHGPLAHARDRAALTERAKRKQRDDHYGSTVARAAERGPTPEFHPHPLRPGEQIVKTFHVSDLPEDVLLAPSFFKLSVLDQHGIQLDKRDFISPGDLLEVYETKKKRLRFVRRAAAVSTERRTVS